MSSVGPIPDNRNVTFRSIDSLNSTALKFRKMNLRWRVLLSMELMDLIISKFRYFVDDFLLRDTQKMFR
jgi:hypothetical protein